MVMGKLGAFLNKDMGALVKDAGRLLNTDLGTIAKDARRALNTDVARLLRDDTQTDTPSTPKIAATAIAEVAAPVSVAPIAPDSLPTFDPDVTQKMERAPLASVDAVPFDPDVTQKMERSPLPVAVERVKAGGPSDSAPTIAFNVVDIDDALLVRATRDSPTGNEIKVLLPYSVGDFDRPHATPSGELTNDPVNAVYASHGETVVMQLTLCWDTDEAAQLVTKAIGRIGAAPRTGASRSWVIGATPQGVVYAWTRDCYFFCATSPKGAVALEQFLSAYPY